MVRALLASHLGLEANAISLDMTLAGDLGLDSVDAVELLISLERTSGQRFEVEHLEDLSTVDDLVARLVDAASGAVEVPQP